MSFVFDLCVRTRKIRGPKGNPPIKTKQQQKIIKCHCEEHHKEQKKIEKHVAVATFLTKNKFPTTSVTYLN